MKNEQTLGNGRDREILESLKSYIKRYYNHNKKMPTYKLLMEKFNVTKHQLKIYFDILTHSGFLKLRYRHYKPVDEKSKEIKIEKKETNKKYDWILLALRIIMFFIGIGAIIISVYYTTIWFDEFLDIFLSILFSVIMVAFSVGTFEVIIIFKQNKQYVLIVPFIFLWIIVVGFSMMSTVAGQYNQRMEVSEEYTTENYGISYKKTIYDTYIEEEERIQKQLDSKGQRLDKLNEMLSEFDLEQLKDKSIKKIYDGIIKEVHVIENEMRILREDLEEKGRRREEYLKENEEKIGITEETEVRRKSFYEWTGSIFKIDAIYIEFWLSIIPALFVDIIAPLSVAVGMFLKRKKGEKNGN